MSELPRVRAREALAALYRAGFVDVPGAKGGHRQLRRPGGGGRVTVPVHGGDVLKPGTLRSILRQAGLSVDEFVALL